MLSKGKQDKHRAEEGWHWRSPALCGPSPSSSYKTKEKGRGGKSHLRDSLNSCPEVVLYYVLGDSCGRGGRPQAFTGGELVYGFEGRSNLVKRKFRDTLLAGGVERAFRSEAIIWRNDVSWGSHFNITGTGYIPRISRQGRKRRTSLSLSLYHS